jgi:uncharacterized protein (DUF934 family)
MSIMDFPLPFPTARADGGAPMRRIILDGEVVTDPWRHVDEDPGGRGGALIFPLSRWRAERRRWWLWAGRPGVRIGPQDGVEELAADLRRLALVAIEFPVPGEGRGYSQARLLRERHGFLGQLRAVGCVQRDHLFFLARCGFDAFELAPGEDPRQAVTALRDFQVAYQPAVNNPLLKLE